MLFRCNVYCFMFIVTPTIMRCGQSMKYRWRSTNYVIVPTASSQCTTTLSVTNPSGLTLIKINRTPLGQRAWCKGEATVELMLTNTSTLLYKAELCNNGSVQPFDIFYRSRANFMLRVTSNKFSFNTILSGKWYNIYIIVLQSMAVQ